MPCFTPLAVASATCRSGSNICFEDVAESPSTRLSLTQVGFGSGPVRLTASKSCLQFPCEPTGPAHVGTSHLGRYCRKSLRKRNVKLEFETNESRHVDFLNQDCALAPDLESMLSRDSCKLLFRQHRPQAELRM